MGEPCVRPCAVGSHLFLYNNGSSLSPSMCPLPQKPVFCYSWQHTPYESQMKPMYFKYKHGNSLGVEITPKKKKKIIIFCCLSGLWPGLVDKQDAFFEKLGPYILAIA